MNREFFTRNRQAIYKAIKTDAIILAGNVSLQRSNDASYAFEQEANFWYLTGIDAPGWWLIIEKDKSYVVAPDVDEVHRMFDGSLSDAEAKEISGVDVVLKHKAGEKLLATMREADVKIATIGEDPHVGHYDFSLNPGPVAMLQLLTDMFGTSKDCRHELATLRAIKSPEEIQLIRHAIQLTIQGFETIRNKIHHYSFEYEIEADIDFQFKKPVHQVTPMIQLLLLVRMPVRCIMEKIRMHWYRVKWYSLILVHV
jgi:Xaa-Pro aminopeptidase